MIQYLTQVIEFTNKYEFEKGYTREGYKARRKLYTEEWLELFEAKSVWDRVEIMDALCDMLYVQLGTYYIMQTTEVIKETDEVIKEIKADLELYGFTLEQFHNCFMEVHESNMSKSFLSQDEIFKTMASLDISDFRVVKKGIEYNVYNNSTKKLIKPSNFKKPNLEQYL